MKIALMNDVIPLTFQKNEVVHKRRRKALNPEKEMSAMDRVQEFSS